MLLVVFVKEQFYNTGCTTSLLSSYTRNEHNSLTMAKGGELVNSNTFKSNLSAPARLLKTAVIYGPNASGKSNFLAAVVAMRRIVLRSATEWQRGDELPVTPFLLDDMSAESPSEFEIVFIADGIRYQYGFVVTSVKVMEEWLVAFPKGRPQHWFARLWNQEIKTYEWEMGNSFTGQKQLWRDATRSNALFLSTAVHLNSEQLQPVFDWFKNLLRVLSVGEGYPDLTASLCKDSDERNKVVKYLKVADLGIDDISVESERISAKHLPDDMPEEIKTISFKMRKMQIYLIFKPYTKQIKAKMYHLTLTLSQKEHRISSLWQAALLIPWKTVMFCS